MSPPLLYVTGTNTAVGKTTLACLLLRRARERNLKIAAIKPFCSGGREDAEKLHALQTAGLTLDEVNPFHFAEPITPYIAARNQNQIITAARTLNAIKKTLDHGHPTLLEGAGGLMSPLGEQFTLLDIVDQLPGKICIVGQNVLGVLNAALLTHRALKSVDARNLHFLLMNPPQPDASSNTNAAVIQEWTKTNTTEFPFLATPEHSTKEAATILDRIVDWWL